MNCVFDMELSRFQVAKVTGDDVIESDENDQRTTSPLPVILTVRDNNHTYTYDTRYAKSLRYYTREALPRLDHYRDIDSVHAHVSRPTLDELHGHFERPPNSTTLSPKVMASVILFLECSLINKCVCVLAG